MQIDRKDVLQSLQKKGFVCTERTKHTFLTYHNKLGKKTRIFTFVSRGTSYKSIQEPLIAKMARQCKLANSDFLDLVDCSMSQDTYDDLIASHA